MRRAQLLILLYLAMVGLSRLALLLIDVNISMHNVAGDKAEEASLLLQLRPWTECLPHIATAIWLCLEALARKANVAIWIVVGLCLGLKGVALFYLITILTEMNRKKLDHPL